eukprot:4904853-Pyramimonas_sp.AAC.1
MTDASEWEAAFVEWESPEGAFIAEGCADSMKQDLKLRPISKDGVGPLLFVAASRAFFDLGITALKEIWRYEGYGKIEGSPD